MIEGVHQVFPDAPRNKTATLILSAMVAFPFFLRMPARKRTHLHRYLYLYLFIIYKQL